MRYQNLEQVTINYYLMDLEMLFSRNPFMQQDGSQLVFIQPNQSQTVKLAAATTQALQTVPLPADLLTRNVLVEVLAAGQRRTAPYFSTALQVQMIENYGQLKITQADGKPQSGVYVKVYARNQDGSVGFYKDGYSDLRGRFDYSSLSTDDLDRVQRFAVLVLSDEHGGVIREADAPKL